MADTKKRIMQYFKNQGVKLTVVVKKISVSEKYFSSKSAVNSDVLEKIAVEFPELNMDWVITGRGEMLYKEQENAAEWKEKYYGLLDMKVTLVSAENEALKKAGNVVTMGHTDELSQVAEPAVELKKE